MEKLYNNIILADDFTSKMSYPNNVPYLKNPPEIINITVGRQLFVDDFLIEKTDLTPEYHKARKFEGNPVLFPETKLETETGMPVACPKSGGVWYDEEDKKYKMWYEAGWLHYLAYAESDDGIHWVRPDLDLVPGTNQILPFDGSVSFADDPYGNLQPDSVTFWIDYDAPKEEKYKMAHHGPRWDAGGVLGTSADGIHWKLHGMTGEAGDRNSFFYNPFRKKWVFSIRGGWGNGDKYFVGRRKRAYWESDSFFEGTDWGKEKNSYDWLSCDIEDFLDPYLLSPKAIKGILAGEVNFEWEKPGLYCVDCVGYESIMLGMFEIHQGLDNRDFAITGAPKITELIPMYSRDGYNYSRPCRDPFIWASRCKGTWDRGYVQSVGGVCIIHGDELWIYYSAFAGDESKGNRNISEKDIDEGSSGMYCNGATGIAILRRDGFVSMNGKGELLTRKLEFTGKKSMGINAIGKVSVEIYDENNTLLAKSEEFDGDSTNHILDFGDFSVESLNSKVFRLKFIVDGKLYSFGFADETGDYGGAHAAGIAEV